MTNPFLRLPIVPKYDINNTFIPTQDNTVHAININTPAGGIPVESTMG